MTSAAAISAGLTYLNQQQATDGSFEGQAQPTPFMAALILSSLTAVPGSQQLREHACSYLLLQRSETWTWNYWQRDHPRSLTQPYPDDLDDTVVALAALSLHNRALIDGAVLAHLTQTLINTESEPGGPYRTWLTTWGDIDLAVNANVGYLLFIHGVHLPKLEAYITQSINDNHIASSYYLDHLPIIYSLSRWYRGTGVDRLNQIIMQELKHANNALSLALAITSAINLGLPCKLVLPAVQKLIEQQQNGRWPSAVYYIGAPDNNIEQQIGSTSLTTAIVLEALARYQDLAISIKRPRLIAKNLPSGDLNRLYHEQVSTIIARDHDGQITNIAALTAAAFGLKIAQKTLDLLNLGSLHGWIAYTIYDNFLDDEASPQLLSVANLCLRQTIKSFHTALPDNRQFCELIATTLDQVDAANTWEIIHARSLDNLPNYGDLSQLAERSWGHILASTGTLIAGGHALGSLTPRAMHNFFYHYLIARQLNDDAHDWEDDLRAERITVVGVNLLKDLSPSLSKVQLEAHLPELRRRTIWSHLEPYQGGPASSGIVSVATGSVDIQWLARPARQRRQLSSGRT
jgi:hypothetical protein